jgi:hypothetical protein
MLINESCGQSHGLFCVEDECTQSKRYWIVRQGCGSVRDRMPCYRHESTFVIAHTMKVADRMRRMRRIANPPSNGGRGCMCTPNKFTLAKHSLRVPHFNAARPE